MRVMISWFVFVVAETVHGVLRRLFVVPIVGLVRANQIGVVVGSGIALAIAWLTVRWIGRRGAGGWMQVGAIWTAATLAFEVGLGVALGAGWNRIAADYDIRRGGWMVLGMAAVFLAPYLAARWRGVLDEPKGC